MRKESLHTVFQKLELFGQIYAFSVCGDQELLRATLLLVVVSLITFLVNG